MELTRVKGHQDIVEDIKTFLFSITGIMPDEVETEDTFKVWFGHDGHSSKAMGIKIDKLKYPEEYKYNGYVALMANVSIMMANYTNFLMWTIDLKTQ